MQQIKIDLFDIFGYLIPGSLLLVTGWILCEPSIIEMRDIGSAVSKFGLNSGIILALFAYALGLAITHLGSYSYEKINKISKYPDSKSKGVNTEKWVLIREYAEKHLSVIDRWVLLKTTSQNFFVVAFCSAIFSIMKFFYCNKIEWLITTAVLLFFARLFFLRARRFERYKDGDILTIVRVLKLEERIGNQEPK